MTLNLDQGESKYAFHFSLNDFCTLQCGCAFVVVCLYQHSYNDSNQSSCCLFYYGMTPTPRYLICFQLYYQKPNFKYLNLQRWTARWRRRQRTIYDLCGNRHSVCTWCPNFPRIEQQRNHVERIHQQVFSTLPILFVLIYSCILYKLIN